MPIIHFTLHDGSVREIDANNGASVMETAIHNNVHGIDAECGGCCSCATCHVYVDEAFLPLLPVPDEMENDLLDAVASPRQPNSRLSCQITVTPELDGLAVQVPETQS
ncbi:MAG: (2Fe-2S)-binding protein [Burkholderiaceae bacterium]|nr:MAG: (2Fe-2S)-binding protein [Burkholderiaceae bacterium]TAM10850.1 MAG: (2Fe-2S)-binding protein [Pusillimonas sp.]